MQVRKHQLELLHGHGTTVGKGVRQGCILSPCLFNLYEEYIMRNAGLEEAQAGFESVLMRWMKLQPIIQSEVSQKEKHHTVY